MPSLRPHSSQPPSSIEDAATQLVDLVGARVHRDIVVPRTTVRAKLRLCSRREVSEARAGARQALIAAGFPVDASALTALGASEEWTYELGIRVLAIAVRDPARPELALATLDEWRECDDDQIAALGKLYEDLEAELDPLGDNAAVLSEHELAEMLAAAKKKDSSTLLMSFGSRRLASFIRTLVDQPATSPTLKS